MQPLLYIFLYELPLKPQTPSASDKTQLQLQLQHQNTRVHERHTNYMYISTHHANLSYTPIADPTCCAVLHKFGPFFFSFLRVECAPINYYSSTNPAISHNNTLFLYSLSYLLQEGLQRQPTTTVSIELLYQQHYWTKLELEQRERESQFNNPEPKHP